MARDSHFLWIHNYTLHKKIILKLVKLPIYTIINLCELGGISVSTYNAHYDHALIFSFFNLRFQCMLKCWELSSEMRPTFSLLVQSLSSFLEGMADYVDIGNLQVVQHMDNSEDIAATS